MNDIQDNALFNIEAFIRSEGVSADLIVIDKIILDECFESHEKASKINELIKTINARKSSKE
jgi:hypothetical protein